jgi:2-keto-4-pentenoate hydratase/2-oxohepta-3-ene-1,7-dioic acid hydratase in catechol pathway
VKIIRFKDKMTESWGVLDPENEEMVIRIQGSIYESWQLGEQVGSIKKLQLVVPCAPRNVVCLAFNYKDLVGKRDSYDEPLVFLKASSTLIDGNTAIRKPSWVSTMWVETELAIVVSKALHNASVEEASQAILGVTIANDVTAANLYGRDHHLARSKSLPTFCPVGSVLTTEINTENLRITSKINGKLTQESTTANRILNDVESLSLVSKYIPLLPGDMILTGTPAGAMDSMVKEGDQVMLEIEGLGKLTNQIIQVD